MGPPTLVQWIGVGIKWVWAPCMVLGGALIVWLLGRDLFKSGFVSRNLDDVDLRRLVAVPAAVIVFLPRALDRLH